MKIFKTINSALEKVEKKMCDVCRIEYSAEEQPFEFQEFAEISFRGGYGSVFGDGDDFELDICQHCLKEKLGAFIRNVTPTPREG